MPKSFGTIDLSSKLAFIALGSNLGNCIETLRHAISELAPLSLQVPLKSSFWRSTPVDCPPGSRDFINAVVALSPSFEETPESLLRKLQQLEKRFGRTPKTILNEPRLLDLDLITFGQEIRNSPALTLPHPRAHLRRFVLEPMAEIAPELVIPGQTKTVRELLSTLRSGEVLVKVASAE